MGCWLSRMNMNAQLRKSFMRRSGGCVVVVIVMMGMTMARLGIAQSAPEMPNAPWHAPIERSIEKQAHLSSTPPFAADATKAYSLAELIDFAESNNPET